MAICQVFLNACIYTFSNHYDDGIDVTRLHSAALSQEQAFKKLIWKTASHFQILGIQLWPWWVTVVISIIDVWAIWCFIGLLSNLRSSVAFYLGLWGLQWFMIRILKFFLLTLQFSSWISKYYSFLFLNKLLVKSKCQRFMYEKLTVLCNWGFNSLFSPDSYFHFKPRESTVCHQLTDLGSICPLAQILSTCSPFFWIIIDLYASSLNSWNHKRIFLVWFFWN